MNKHLKRKTRSLCPVCLSKIEAYIYDDGQNMFMEKHCNKCGDFSVPVWRNYLSYDEWTSNSKALGENEGLCCPENCGICIEHEKDTCCAVLEVTNRCNLSCNFCYANEGSVCDDFSFEEIKSAIKDIYIKGKAPLLQLSGGEPTVRDDLPEIIAYAKEVGFEYIQVNTNGIRIAEEEGYAKKLSDAGLNIVFLQFDGTTDDIFEKLRGRALLNTKLKCIKNCGDSGIGVTLVPTVVRGVNDDKLGEIIEFAKENIPNVRGVHFQPVSYFGKYPSNPDPDDRITLDELIHIICKDTGLDYKDFIPSKCDHPLCGLHASFLVEDGKLIGLSKKNSNETCESSAKKNREYIAGHWMRKEIPDEVLPGSFEEFIIKMRTSTLLLSSMDFQDAGNIDIERLHRCSLHVYHDGKLIPFCVRYLSAQ